MMPWSILPTLTLLAAPAQGLPQHLKEPEVVHADFSQVRTLPALSRPLKQSGSLVMAKGRGVLWQVRKPLTLTYVIGAKGLMVVDAEGRKERRAAQELPVVGQMGRIFQALAQGDWHTLEAWFAIAGTGTPSRWEVKLTPIAQAAGFIRSVRITGGRFVETLQIDQPGGERMELRFTGQRIDLPVSETEARLLAQD